MKLSELALKLTEATKDFANFKIHTHRDFHDKINDLMSNLLPEACTCAVWEIRYKGIPILTYNRLFTPYKNCRYGDKGNFSNVSFLPEIILKDDSKIHPDLFLSDVEIFVNKKNHQIDLANAQKNVSNCEKELLEAQEHLKRLENKTL